MSVNDSIDPRFIFHVDDGSLRFRQRFSGNGSGEEQTCYSDEDDDCAAEESNKGSKNPAVREDEEEEEKSSIDGQGKEFKVMISNSNHHTQAKRGFASMEKERVGSWESLKSILSDPVTGALMNDATILPCGHSFGAGGLQQVIRMKACFTCSQPTSQGSEKPNLSLRVVVHAFCQEQDLDHIYSLKRRKERSDQHKRNLCNPRFTETPKTSSRGIQFPFSIGDRIIIEGNKRTPPRFVGRKAVIMTHCLNGWYVVKTVDNAESIKLQHCSLAKISDNSPPKVTVAEMAPPHWL